MLHLYKNRLQQLAQKRNLTLPTYSCETEGPPHACRFKARVDVDGKTFGLSQFFSSLKDAQHAAAKVAFEALSPNEFVEDESLYKGLLQEFAQKKGFSLPSYCTTVTGMSHMPIFMSTVEVGGETFQGPETRSKKQAEMNAAKVAYNTLMQREGSKSLSDDSSMKDSLEVSLTSLQKDQSNDGSNSCHLHPMGQAIEDKGMLHLYKNQLQNYTQRRDLGVPVYSCEVEGPHARHFKSRVTVHGKTYEAPQFFPTIKDAEQAAAKVAYEALSLNEIPEDGGFYKSLLQEYAQKNGFMLPSYDTIRSGLPHMASFMSTVKVGGESFRGKEAKNKKQAEINAAKIAHTALVERKASRIPFPGNVEGDRKAMFTSFHSNDGVNINCVPDVGSPANKKGSTNYEEIKVSAPRLVSSAIDAEQIKHPKDTDNMPVIQDAENGENNAKRLRCLSSSDVNAQMTVPSNSTYGVAGAVSFEKKVTVYPRHLNKPVPDGASVMPVSSDKWVAFGFSHQQQ